MNKLHEMEESKTFEELNELVIQWANDKGILSKATPLSQHGKTEEEVAELREALFAQQNNLLQYVNSKGQEKNTREEVKDGLGDSLVTLLIQCKLQNLSPLECLEIAYNVISKRKGKMVEGVFVKEDDNQISILEQKGVV